MAGLVGVMRTLTQMVFGSIMLQLVSIDAHPGAIAEGRGSCGGEFDSARKAFRIPDISESWFVRRVSTCTHPFFWVTFNTTRDNQEVTFVTGSPESADFQDKLNFNAVLFGPGYEPLATPPAALVDWKVSLPSGLGGKVLASPSSFASCDFVSNPVMAQYKKETNGRCMEHMTMAAGFKTVGLAGKTWNNYWLSNDDLKIPRPGTHYLVVWASHRTTGKVSSGRLEVTMGPWSWSGYASDSVTKETQSQSTTCSCATNHASWYAGQNIDMLGHVSPSLFSEQLPFQECSPGIQSTSSCRASTKATPIPTVPNYNASAVEWSGVFDLKAGTYNWDFFAFKYYDEWKFPDSAMDVIIVRTNGKAMSDLEGAETSADKAMTASLADAPSPSLVLPSGTMNVSGSAPVAFRLSLPKPTNASNSNVTFEFVVPTDGYFAVFTQHQPAEFLAEQLTCTTSCAAGLNYVFWKASKAYGVAPNKATEIIAIVHASTTSTAPAGRLASLILFVSCLLCLYR